MRITARQPRYQDPAAKWLEDQSKAALIDCVIDLMRPGQESCDDPISAEAAYERLAGIIEGTSGRKPKPPKKPEAGE